ncbi:hypothetical protein LXL04_000268 [Taraxacum kok-saghyz]
MWKVERPSTLSFWSTNKILKDDPLPAQCGGARIGMGEHKVNNLPQMQGQESLMNKNSNLVDSIQLSF